MKLDPENARNITEVLYILKDMISARPNEWLPVYAAIGGALVGAIASFVPTLIVETVRSRREARQLELSMIAEIIALVEVIEVRGYLQNLKNIIEEFDKNQEIVSCCLSMDIQIHYSRIYQENCARIGLIRSDVAVKIVRFHQLIDALVQDVKPGGTLSKGGSKECFLEDMSILEQAIGIGKIFKSANNNVSESGPT